MRRRGGLQTLARRYRRPPGRLAACICITLIMLIIFTLQHWRGTLRQNSALDLASGEAGSLRLMLESAMVSKKWGYMSSLEELLANRLGRNLWGPEMLMFTNGTLSESTMVLDNSSRPHRAAMYTTEELWASYQAHAVARQATGCDALTVPFVPLADERCIQYMTQIANWKSIVPMNQGLDQRTIKFAVHFKPLEDLNGEPVPSIQTILKVPQRHFSHEAFSEVAAYHADRVMGIGRVPPTGWVCIPVKTIRDAVGLYKNSVKTQSQFMEEMKVNNYEDWIEKDMLTFAQEKGLVETDEVTGDPCIGASVQLRVADVSRLLVSSLRIPYDSHNDTWHQFFNFSPGSPQRASSHLPRHSRLPKSFHTSYGPSVLHIAELSIYDFVIGNMDRSPNKNSFVVGGHQLVPLHNHSLAKKMMKEENLVDHEEVDPLPLHPNHPTFIHLDQGMAFYLHSKPRRNPISESQGQFEQGKEDTFCLFPASLLRRLIELSVPVREIPAGFPADMETFTLDSQAPPTLLETLLSARLPPAVRRFMKKDQLEACSMRMRRVLAMAGRCAANPDYGDYVFFP